MAIDTREIAILKDFIITFSPFHTWETLDGVNYNDLVSIAKSVAEIL